MSAVGSLWASQEYFSADDLSDTGVEGQSSRKCHQRCWRLRPSSDEVCHWSAILFEWCHPWWRLVCWQCLVRTFHLSNPLFLTCQSAAVHQPVFCLALLLSEGYCSEVSVLSQRFGNSLVLVAKQKIWHLLMWPCPCSGWQEMVWGKMTEFDLQTVSIGTPLDLNSSPVSDIWKAGIKLKSCQWLYPCSFITR